MRVLIKREIELPEIWPDERVPAKTSKMAGSWNAGTGRPVEGRRAPCPSDRSARHREGTQVKKLCGIVLVVVHRPDDIGTAEALAAAVKIILEVVVELERLPG